MNHLATPAMLAVTLSALCAQHSARAHATKQPAEQPPSPGKVTTVRVHNGHARVTRQRQVRCEGARATATFFPLPAGLASHTLRAQADGTALADVHAEQRELAARDEDPRLRAARAALRTHASTLEGIARARAQDRAELRAIHARETALLAALAGESAEAPPAARAARTLDAHRAARFAIIEREARRTQQARALRAELVLAEREIRLLVAQWRAVKIVPAYTPGIDQLGPLVGTAVRVEGKCTGKTAVLTLSYDVPGVHWRPTYDVRHTDGRVTIEMHAVLAQRTGEAWHGAHLQFASLPGRGAHVGPVNVGADGGAYHVPLLTLHSTAKPVFVRERGGAKHRTAMRFTNPAPFGLPAGQVRLHDGGTYLGNARLDAIAPGETAELPFPTPRSTRVTP